MPRKNKKVSLAVKPFLVLSRRAIAGWLLVLFFICGWMFAIGVMVGRDRSSLNVDINPLKKELAPFMEKIKKKDPQQASKGPGPDREKPALDFYEALPQNREVDKPFEASTSPPKAEKIEPPPEKKSSFKKKQSKKKLTRIRKKVVEDPQPAKKEAAEKSMPQPAVAKARVDSPDHPYTIQVAAYKRAGDADKLVAELQQKGFAAYRKFDKIPNKGIWYRVRVGQYKNRAEAVSTIAKLKKAGREAILVKK